MPDALQLHYRVGDDDYGRRLDQVATAAFADYSRARIQSWIKTGQLRVDGKQARAKDKLHGGELLELQFTPEPETHWQPEPVPVHAVYEDRHLIVINKPAGLVVHPGAGVSAGTLLNGLLYHYPELSVLPRAGIVHRLDKDTSGIMVVARSLVAHASLVQQLQDRTMGREYEAVVMGELTGGGSIDKPIGRHPSHRIKMAVLPHSQTAKPALTHYRVVQPYRRYTHIACQLASGRTHQIRVHMASIHHPLVGDPVYAGRQRWVAGTPATLKQCLSGFKRQALHARHLRLYHPQTGEEKQWSVALPDDFQALLQALSHDQQAQAW
ncbi:MAG: 23S rRNA pseudouridine(1911/1915/1917) synthase RluD [Cellvibrionaceae bacterium]|nr:23S rRNA pseudouridine(1911/1915/1917) synthase RluD [Cellvibrionaceae bacterium]